MNFNKNTRIVDTMSVFYQRKLVEEKELEKFSQAYDKYMASVDANVDAPEEKLKNFLTDFLQAANLNIEVGYQVSKGDGASTIDMVSVDEDGDVELVVETKAVKSKELTEDLDCKAFYEALLYYIRLRSKGNYSLQHIILTNFYEFYIFKAKEFEALFNQKNIKKFYDKWSSSNNLFKNVTAEFYNEVKKILKNESISGLYFNLKDDYDKVLLYKLFHPDYLLGKFKPNDANELNNKFYQELLYLLGLVKKEIKPNNFKIKVSGETLNQKGTLYYNIAQKLGLKVEEEINEDILSIIVIWLNRILFLKLLEANLIRFNDNSLKFLNIEHIKSYSDLSNLFFNILAKKIEERGESDLDYLPYLNSSLFIKQDRELVDIATLSNLKLSYFKNTQIKDNNGKKLEGEVDWIKYLFEFLDAFDFGVIPNRDLVIHKELINSSVLGLIYEELNGFKDGAFFTPNAITSYMCKESIVPMVLSKFREHGLNANSIEELQQQVVAKCSVDFSFRDKAIKVLESIKIIDPGVGSGHFLVSALNEMVYIYYKLCLLSIPISELKIENDEVIIIDNEGEIFEYKRPKANTDNHKIQTTIFNVKKSIIENNLFGVDINPNSCEITTLRLWIELLKNTYYLSFKNDNYHDMQTLPNIDINIKCGNSLTGRIPLNMTVDECVANLVKRESDDMFDNYAIQEKCKSIIPQIKDLFIRMKDASVKYKTASREDASQYKSEYEQCKENLLQLFIEGSGEGINFYITLRDFFREYGYTNIRSLEEQDEILEYIYKFRINEFVDDFMKKKIEINPKKLNNLLSCMKNYKINNKGIEFRFEFPELLDEEFNFKGFDIVIGNPPYGAKINEEQKKIYKENYKTAKTIKGVQKGSLDTYTLFIEKGFDLLRKDGNLAYIVPISFTSSDSLTGVHCLLENNCETIRVSSYAVRPQPIFANAVVNTSIIIFQKTLTPCKNIFSTKMYRKGKNFNLQNLIDNLQFAEVKDLKMYGRIPKISLPIEKNILYKIFKQKPIKEFIKDKGGEPVYYRVVGGRYFKIVTNYTTNSNTETFFLVDKKYRDLIGCILSSNLSFWFYQVYSNNLSWTFSDISSFTIPSNSINSQLLKSIKDLYDNYLVDIEKNANIRKVSKESKYTMDDFKEYKIGKSKHIIDKIDRLICPLYGLTEEETEFIINYDLEFRV